MQPCLTGKRTAHGADDRLPVASQGGLAAGSSGQRRRARKASSMRYLVEGRQKNPRRLLRRGLVYLCKSVAV